MASESRTLESVRYSRDTNELLVLDQLLLPQQTKFIRVEDTQGGWEVIRKMNVSILLSCFIDNLKLVFLQAQGKTIKGP